MSTLRLAMAAVLLLPATAVCGDSNVQADAEAVADVFARCAAVWEWSSDAMAQAGRPDTAEYLHNMANGARTAAYWALGNADVVINKGREPRKYGYWEPYITPKVEGHLSQIKAYMEMGQSLEQDLDLCVKLSSDQSDIIDGIRKDYLD